MGKTWQWHFSRPDGGDFLPGMGRLARIAGMPQADADLPDRLRAAGMLDAFDAGCKKCREDWEHSAHLPTAGWLAFDVEPGDPGFEFGPG